MKGKRNMFYSDYQAGGFYQPQPQGFFTNQQYQAFGPNVIPNNMYSNQTQDQVYSDDIDQRIDRIENLIRKLDQRISKLENISLNSDAINSTNNSYII